jgi:hypothetical protein
MRLDGALAADSRRPPSCRRSCCTQACGPSRLPHQVPSISATSGRNHPRRPAHAYRCPMCVAFPCPFPFTMCYAFLLLSWACLARRARRCVRRATGGCLQRGAPGWRAYSHAHLGCPTPVRHKQAVKCNAAPPMTVLVQHVASVCEHMSARDKWAVHHVCPNSPPPRCSLAELPSWLGLQ